MSSFWSLVSSAASSDCRLLVLEAIDLGGVDDVELHVAEAIEDRFHVGGIDEVLGEDLVDVVVSEIVLLLGELDELAHLLLDLGSIDAALALGELLGLLLLLGGFLRLEPFPSCPWPPFLRIFLAATFLAGAFLVAVRAALTLPLAAFFLAALFLAVFFLAAVFLAEVFFLGAFFAAFLAFFFAGARLAAFLALGFLRRLGSCLFCCLLAAFLGRDFLFRHGASSE